MLEERQQLDSVQQVAALKLWNEDLSMVRKTLVAGMIFASAVFVAFAAETPTVHSKLTAAQIVDRNVAARGGLQAWRGGGGLRGAGVVGGGGDERAAQAGGSAGAA